MRIGIIADVHEDVERLAAAVRALRDEGIDRLVFLGDLAELGTRLDECVDILTDAAALGVFGNHELGFCVDPEPDLLARYSTKVVSFMRGLQPMLMLGGCWFAHVEPYLDVRSVEDYYLEQGGPEAGPERVRRSFECRPERVMFVGHYHTWSVITPSDVVEWVEPGQPMHLKPPERRDFRFELDDAPRCGSLVEYLFLCRGEVFLRCVFKVLESLIVEVNISLVRRCRRSPATLDDLHLSKATLQTLPAAPQRLQDRFGR